MTERFYSLEQGFPTWGTCTSRGTFALSEGVHLRLAIGGINIFAGCLFSNIYTYIT